jgi:hypothetical protein
MHCPGNEPHDVYGKGCAPGTPTIIYRAPNTGAPIQEIAAYGVLVIALGIMLVIAAIAWRRRER